jgi:uncharacterized membrane protein YhdT
MKGINGKKKITYEGEIKGIHPTPFETSCFLHPLLLAMCVTAVCVNGNWKCRSVA